MNTSDWYSDVFSHRLMECGICNELMHPECLREQNPHIDHEGAINEDLPNSWECPKCCEAGKQGQIRVSMGNEW